MCLGAADEWHRPQPEYRGVKPRDLLLVILDRVSVCWQLNRTTPLWQMQCSSDKHLNHSKRLSDLLLCDNIHHAVKLMLPLEGRCESNSEIISEVASSVHCGAVTLSVRKGFHFYAMDKNTGILVLAWKQNPVTLGEFYSACARTAKTVSNESSIMSNKEVKLESWASGFQKNSFVAWCYVTNGPFTASMKNVKVKQCHWMSAEKSVIVKGVCCRWALLSDTPLTERQ